MTRENSIPFVKMQGTGNDFVVLDNRDDRWSTEELVKLTLKLCHRKYGVGADGLLALQQPERQEADYTMIYRNADGSDAGMCGNGSRCLALLASKIGLGRELTFTVHDKTYGATVVNDQKIAISFPVQTEVEEIIMAGERLWQVYTGTEHVVKEVSHDMLGRVKKLVESGRRLRNHQQFQPGGTNADFFCGVDEQTLKLQTYERGVENLTLACGTGAIAAALCWHHKQQGGPGEHLFKVQTEGGPLNVKFRFDGQSENYRELQLIGPARMVFEGSYYV